MIGVNTFVCDGRRKRKEETSRNRLWLRLKSIRVGFQLRLITNGYVKVMCMSGGAAEELETV